MPTTSTYTQNQFADAVEYLCVTAGNPQDRKELLELQGALRGIPKDEHLGNLARNANHWANLVEKNLHLCLPEHRERLLELIKNLRSPGGL